MTFREVWAEVLRFAAGLRHHGIRAGDRVAIAMRNLTEFLIAFLASTAVGAVATLLNAWWTEKELSYAIGDAEPACVIADVERASRLSSALRGRPTTLIVVCDRHLPANVAALSPLSFSAVVATGANSEHLSVVSDSAAVRHGIDDPVIIMYTAGTTGFPKGVVQTERGVCTTVAQMLLGAETKKVAKPTAPQECIVVSQPFFHVSALYQKFLGALVSGRRFVMMPKWEAGEALRLMSSEGASSIGGVPTMILDLVQHPDFARSDLRSLATVGVGGAAAPPALLHRVRKEFPSATPMQAYGMTETNGEVSRITGDELFERPDSVGRPFRHVEVVVVSPQTLEPLPTGTEGELLVKGATLLNHYWRREKESVAAIVAVPGRSGRWLRTGDIAALDDQGRIYIRGRMKDIIIRGGENISCAEIEAAVYELVPCASEVAAYSLPHRRLGEVPGLTVTVKRGVDPPSADSIRQNLLRSLAKFKVPEAADILLTTAALPRGATDKILRRNVRQLAIDARRPPSKL
eukprot:TRINITY_DN9565_c0_g1_i1.p1 TRINITY_DN9565_c0_g1~~TRINITY_DN9565_c0_g1_i1.p1  ORF type:complete len:520 (+),score=166.53 TRINITY_DN9565_c0_g1_i1:210-1769(+)